MSTHLLCAIDLTHDADARALIAEAGRLAGLESAALSLATVIPDYGSSWVGSFFKEGTLKEAAESARIALHKLADETLGDAKAVQCIVAIGNPYEEVLTAAGKCGADLIVIGAHKPDLAQRIAGPNASRIARNADVSVLVVRL